MLYDGDTFEHGGREFTVRFQHDDCSDAPWEMSDGHGPVSDWTTRDKLPGERLLNSDRGRSRRFYDFAEATRVAKKDGWGLCPDDIAKLAAKLGRQPTRKQIVREAVERDFEFLRSWCNDEWHYCGVIVEHAESGKSTSCWGVEDNAYDYLETLAHELAGELAFELDSEMAAAITESRPDMYGEAR